MWIEEYNKDMKGVEEELPEELSPVMILPL